MKKLLTACLSLSLSILFNQSFAGNYVELHIGYGLPSGSQNIDWEVNNLIDITMVDLDVYQNGSFTYLKSSQINLSLGEGFNTGLAFGHDFNEHVSGELGLSYLFGSTTTATYTGFDESATNRLSASLLRINPSVVIDAGSGDWVPYAKFGFIVGFGKVDFEAESISASETSNGRLEIDGTAAGWTSSIGIRHEMSSKVSLFGEVSLVAMNYTPSKAKLTEYDINGVDQLNTLTVSDREVEFVDDFDFPATLPQPTDQPYTTLQKQLPFGSIGLRIGARINL